MKKHFFALLLFLLFTKLNVSFSFAAPLINEFSSATSDDWVEIYNSGPEVLDLSKYRLRDSTATNKLDLSGTIPIFGFMSFDWSNKLNKSGDLIKLVLVADDSVVDQAAYGSQGGTSAPGIDQTAGRKTDGGEEWSIFSSSTKNGSNNSSTVVVPPTLTPTKILTPAKLPSPTKSPTSPKTPTPTKIPTPTKTQSSVNNSSIQTVKSVVSSTNVRSSAKITQKFKIDSNFASVRNVSRQPTKIPDVKVLGTQDQNFSVFFTIGGLMLVLGAGIWVTIKYIDIREVYEKIFNKQ